MTTVEKAEEFAYILVKAEANARVKTYNGNYHIVRATEDEAYVLIEDPKPRMFAPSIQKDKWFIKSGQIVS
ncbi:hypothetical protein [Niallia sp. Krafla_26]|uniref:hypothetical protein n=1 Tax=Niallia sp. Krafla_26 TaxID=3064703 RepID=UPI003D170E45